MNSANQNTISYLRSLETQHVWGFITLKYEGGNIVHLRREENLKPSAIENLPETTRGNHDQRSN
jgi:hypothetical protein